MKSVKQWKSLWHIFLGFLVLTVFPAFGASSPSISTQPQSQNVFIHSNAVFTVVASGSPTLVYQWWFNGLNLSNNLQISGATSTTLTVSNVNAGNAGNYQVFITNSHGSVTSSIAVLTVLVPAA